MTIFIYAFAAIISALYLLYKARKSLTSQEQRAGKIMIVLVLVPVLFIIIHRLHIRSESRRKVINEELKLCKSWYRTMNFIKSHNYGIPVTSETKRQFEDLKKDFLERKNNRHYRPYIYKKIDSKLYGDLDKCSKDIEKISLEE